MASDIATDLADFGIISVSLWPGAVKTEIVEQTVLSGRGKVTF
jgi:NAD(P)-dependent dehydrogenase (short-subunit alcohol dehydrogenase family)